MIKNNCFFHEQSKVTDSVSRMNESSREQLISNIDSRQQLGNIDSRQQLGNIDSREQQGNIDSREQLGNNIHCASNAATRLLLFKQSHGRQSKQSMRVCEQVKQNILQMRQNKRKTQLERITDTNIKLFIRLQSQKSLYSKKHLARDSKPTRLIISKKLTKGSMNSEISEKSQAQFVDVPISASVDAAISARRCFSASSRPRIAPKQIQLEQLKCQILEPAWLIFNSEQLTKKPSRQSNLVEESTSNYPLRQVDTNGPQCKQKPKIRIHDNWKQKLYLKEGKQNLMSELTSQKKLSAPFTITSKKRFFHLL